MAEAYVLTTLASNFQRLLTRDETLAATDVGTHLEVAKCLLFDVKEKPSTDSNIRKVVEEIISKCYEMESVLEDLAPPRRIGTRMMMLQDILRRCLCLFSEHRAQPQPQPISAKTINMFAREIEQLSMKLEQLGLIKQAIAEQNAYRPLKNESNTNDDDDLIIGLEQDVENMVSMLLLSEEDEGNHPVIAILGKGGSGKTTLARQLYKHPKVVQGFETCAWITVGHAYRAKPVLQEMLLQLIPESKEEDLLNQDIIQLVQKLSWVLQKNKCLLVLDDIWSLNVWESLSIAFKMMKSKVIVTTRVDYVAKRVAKKGFIHQMRPLSIDESWNLLKIKAFPPKADINPKNYEKFGESIASKCRGLPLQVVTLGSLLATKQTPDEWQRVAANLAYDSDVEQVIYFSFNVLPPHLKPCFLYLGLFPEDSNVDAEKLYLLWMAEGIVPTPEHGENRDDQVTPVEKATFFLTELAARNMVSVEAQKVRTIRRYKSCRLHDLMRDVCLEIGEANNFFTASNHRRSNLPFPSAGGNRNSEARRLAIYQDELEGYSIQGKIADPRRVRSLLFFNEYQHEHPKLWPAAEKILLQAAIFLRILDFSGFNFEKKLPGGIDGLLHLRYLSFRGCYLRELPSYIGNLSNLQTLDLRVIASCKMSIPNILRKLERLMHLYLPVRFQARGANKLDFTGLSALVILENFDTSACQTQHILKLSSIRFLSATISNGSHEDLIAVSRMILSSRSMLEAYIFIKNFDCYTQVRQETVNELFRCPQIHTLYIDGHIRELPPVLPTYSVLTKLSFSGSELGAALFQTLKHLPNLWILVLHNDAYIEVNMAFPGSPGFRKLRQLQISELRNLNILSFEQGAMPNLACLVIERCNNLELVEGLRFITSLRELKIARMPEEFKSKLKNSQEEFNTKLDIKYQDDHAKVSRHGWLQ